MRAKSSTSLAAWYVFLGFLCLYIAAWRWDSSSDTYSTTIIPFNLIKHSTLSLDNLPGAKDNRPRSELLLYSVIAPNGKTVGIYPIGSALMTFPLQAVLWELLRLIVGEVDLADPWFPRTRLIVDKISASILAAATLAMFYLLASMLVSRKSAIVTTFVYGLSTNHWNINAQLLWQHTTQNFLLVLILLLFVNRQRHGGSFGFGMALSIGVMLGTMFSIRPTNIPFLVVLGGYSILTKLSKGVPLIFGAVIGMLPAIVWNCYFFHHPLGGYWVTSRDILDFSVTGMTGRSFLLLFHPVKGMLLFSPVLLFVPLAFRQPVYSQVESQRIVFPLGAICLAHIIITSLSSTWMGGRCYGPRYLQEILPILMFYLLFVIDNLIHGTRSTVLTRLTIGVLSVCFLYGTFIQAAGFYFPQLTIKGEPFAQYMIFYGLSHR